MKKELDHTIQEHLEDKTPKQAIEWASDEVKELKRYEALFDLLTNTPSPNVPSGFAPNVIHIIQTRRDRKQTFLLYALFSLLLLFAVALCVWLISNQVILQLITVSIQYQRIFLFSLLMFVFIHVAEKKLIVDKPLT